MERLLVDGEDHHLGPTEDLRIVERPHLEEHGARHLRRAGEQVRPALAAELPRDGVRQILPLEALRGALRVFEPRLGHAHDEVRVPAGDVLTLPAMTLALEQRIARDRIANRAAVTAALKFHPARIAEP